MRSRSSSSSSRVSEIEIEEDEWYRSEELFEIKHLESIYEETGKEDEEVVYVALLGQTTSSSSHDMDALVWTLNQLLDPFSESVVNLVHVFPQLHYIPTPCKVISDPSPSFLILLSSSHIILSKPRL